MNSAARMSTAIRALVWITPVAFLAAVPPLRHLALYNLVPLMVVYAGIAFADRRLSPRMAVALILSIFVMLHVRSLLVHPILLVADSHGYIEWGRQFSLGNGFPGMIYRAPLYPFLLGVTFLFGDSLYSIVVLQHLALIGSALLTFRLALECRLGHRVALLSMVLVGLNSILMQMAQAVLTEAVFVFLVLLCLLMLIRLYKGPSATNAILTGVSFSAASHLRPLLVPFFLAGAAILVVRKGRPVVRFVLMALGVIVVCTAPWSLRNYSRFGAYGMSSNLGIQLLTKLTSYRLEHQDGTRYRSIEPILTNVQQDLGLGNYEAPKHPEDSWTVNHIPHALADSLTMHHGYSFVRAEKLMGRVSLEGFVRHPLKYCASVGRSLATMLFEHREHYPDVGMVLPVPAGTAPPLLVRLARGLVYVPGLLFLLYPGVLLLQHRLSLATATPFLVSGSGLLLTALVQVGFTRYTVPWIPLQAVCGAVVVCALVDFFRQKSH